MSFVNTRDVLGNQETLDALIAHTLEEFREDAVMSLRSDAFYHNNGLKRIEMPGVTAIPKSAFDSCTALEEASFENVNKISTRAFFTCTALQTIQIPNLETDSSYAFGNCSALQAINFPKLKTASQYAFDGCSSVQSVNLPALITVYGYSFRNVPCGAPCGRLSLPVCTSIDGFSFTGNGPCVIDLAADNLSFYTNTFNGNKNLFHLILRANTVIPMRNTNALTATPIAAGLGMIYVPANLVDSYKAAANWSSFASQIHAIEDFGTAYPISGGTITDSWAEIFAAEQDGTYSAKYSIGDTKLLRMGDLFMLVQIVAFDADTLADGSGNAKITWLCVNRYGTHAMNSTSSSANGWAASEMRSYLADDVLPNIEPAVKAGIKEVSKTYYDYSSQSTLACDDKIWIPSYREVFGGTSVENAGAVYSGLFVDNNSRKRYESILKGTTSEYWLRSAKTPSTFEYIGTGGSTVYNTYFAKNKVGVIFGFCT